MKQTSGYCWLLHCDMNTKGPENRRQFLMKHTTVTIGY